MATTILMPRQGQSVESCVLVEWKVERGDIVAAGDPVAEIETDKATFEVESPEAGTILALLHEAGADVPVLTPIAVVGAPGEVVEAAPLPATRPEPAPASTGAASPLRAATGPASAAKETQRESAGISPRARHLAAKEKVEVAEVAGTGPGGRRIERDIQAAIRARKAARPAPELEADLPPRETQRVTGARKIIAERMRHSLTSTAQLTLHRSFDATTLQLLRFNFKARASADGSPSITINDMLLHAVSRVLLLHPALNAHFHGDRIDRFSGVNLGVAVDTPRGLMVPVLREAHRLSLAQLHLQVRSLAEACRGGAVSPDLLRGGTFTVTNLGGLGVEYFTPVLNPPEVAILGVGGINLKPIADGNRIRHVPVIVLSLTIDHQAVDGAPAARFLADLTMALEDFDPISNT